MDYELVISEFLSNPRISFYLNQLKTSNWKKMKETEKKKFFTKFNESLCEYLDINSFNIYFDGNHVNEEDVSKSSNYKNIKVEYGKKKMTINDINYNQYLTLYEYLFRVREEVQNLSIFTNYNKVNDEEKKKIWIKSTDNVRLGEIKVDFYIEEGEYLSEYQDIKLDAKEFAEKIMFKIVKDNYDVNNSYDEEYFMSNEDILVDELLASIAGEMIDREMLDNDNIKNIVNKIKKKIDKYYNCDFSKLSDEDLYMAVYPYININIDAKILVKAYQEIINRIYDDSINIRIHKNTVIINDNVYNEHYFMENPFNIILYECIRKLDSDLRNDSDFINNEEYMNEGLEKTIISFKKKWLYSTLMMIDRNTNYSDLSVFKYQPLYRLVNKENLIGNLESTKNGNVPLRKRRK